MKKYAQLVLASLLALLLQSPSALAKGTYMQPDEFIQQAFNSQPPEPSVIWIKDELRDQVETILQHKYKGKRLRYWKQQQRSAWILEEIGKKKPITVGIVIEDQKITRVKVLVFRETRGWEVRYPFFTDQFNSLTLTEDHELSHHVDGVSGATLSVRALKKLARIALLLDQVVNTK